MNNKPKKDYTDIVAYTIVGIIVCLVAVYLIYVIYCKIDLAKKAEEDTYSTYSQMMLNAALVKFEYNNSGKIETMYIDGNTFNICHALSDLDLIECDNTISDWIFRITFNYRDTENAIEVLIGEQALSIDGKTFTSKENLDFAEVVEIFEYKFYYYEKYFTVY
jgi:hypothetical protein